MQIMWHVGNRYCYYCSCSVLPVQKSIRQSARDSSSLVGSKSKKINELKLSMISAIIDLFQSCGTHRRHYLVQGEGVMLGFGMSFEPLNLRDKMMRSPEKAQT